MTLCPHFDYEQVDDPSDVWEEKEVRARKEHTCCECGKSINPGEQYGLAKSPFDGSWSTFRRCPACLILAEMVATMSEACPLWGGLSEAVDYANEELAVGVRPILGPFEHRILWESKGGES